MDLYYGEWQISNMRLGMTFVYITRKSSGSCAYSDYEAENSFTEFYLKQKVLLGVEKILPLSP
jgi:hypothetical protein